MRYLNYCILFLVIILYCITPIFEGYTSYADIYKNTRGFYSAQDKANEPPTKENIKYFSIGAIVSSTEYPFKRGTITDIPSNSYDNIDVTYPGEATAKSVKRSSITVLSDPTQTTSSRWKGSHDYVDAHSYTYDPNHVYDLSGNSRHSWNSKRPSGKSSTSSLLTEDELYTVWEPKKPGIVSKVKSKVGSWFNSKKPSPSMDKTALIPENDILGDYTSPPVQSSKQDPLGYTADSATINKIYQLLNGMVTKNHCETSAFGCCKDKFTPKSDHAGSNCSEAIVVGLTDDVKKYIDTTVSEKTYSFTPSTSTLLQTKLPSTRSESAVQNSYTNTVFLAQPKGFDPPPACPQSSFDSRVTPTYSQVDSEVLPLPSLTMINH